MVGPGTSLWLWTMLWVMWDLSISISIPPWPTFFIIYLYFDCLILSCFGLLGERHVGWTTYLGRIESCISPGVEHVLVKRSKYNHLYFIIFFFGEEARAYLRLETNSWSWGVIDGSQMSKLCLWWPWGSSFNDAWTSNNTSPIKPKLQHFKRRMDKGIFSQFIVAEASIKLNIYTLATLSRSSFPVGLIGWVDTCLKVAWWKGKLLRRRTARCPQMKCFLQLHSVSGRGKPIAWMCHPPLPVQSPLEC